MKKDNIEVLRGQIEAVKAVSRETVQAVAGTPGARGLPLPWQTNYHCTRCGNLNLIQPPQNQVGNPGPDDEFRYCPKCFPALAAVKAQYRELRVARSKRQHEAYRMREWRRNCLGYERVHVGSYYSRCWFRTYKASSALQGEALDQVRKWALSATNRAAVPFVLVFGAPGLGKSHLAVAAWRQITRFLPSRGTKPSRAAVMVKFVDEGRLWERWRQSHRAYDKNSDYEGPTPDDIIEELKSAGVLIWDDLGKVKMTEAWFATAFAILNYRMAHALPTLFTSNYGPSVLAGRMEPSLARRAASGMVLQVAPATAAAA